MKNDYKRILTQIEIDELFCLGNETLTKMLNEIIKELGYNPCVFNTDKSISFEYSEWATPINPNSL